MRRLGTRFVERYCRISQRAGSFIPSPKDFSSGPTVCWAFPGFCENLYAFWGYFVCCRWEFVIFFPPKSVPVLLLPSSKLDWVGPFPPCPGTAEKPSECCSLFATLLSCVAKQWAACVCCQPFCPARSLCLFLLQMVFCKTQGGRSAEQSFSGVRRDHLSRCVWSLASFTANFSLNNRFSR